MSVMKIPHWALHGQEEGNIGLKPKSTLSEQIDESLNRTIGFTGKEIYLVGNLRWNLDGGNVFQIETKNKTIVVSSVSKQAYWFIGLSKKRPLWSKAWSRSEKNVFKNYTLPSLRYTVGGGGR